MTDVEIERVAIVLFKKMEHLDPTEDGDFDMPDFGWSKLDEHRKEFYRLCVKAVARELGVE